MDNQGQFLCNALIGAAYLVPCLLWDIRTRTIPGWYLALGLLLASGGSVVFTILGRIPLWEIFASLLPGLFLLTMSYLTREKIGYGDGICFLILGLMEGPVPCMLVMLLSFLLSSAASILGMCLHRAGKNTRIPFVPFIIGGIAVQALFLVI